MREQMVLEETLIGVELSASKKQFKWIVAEPPKKRKENDDDDDDNESNEDMSALQKIIVVHSAVLGAGAKADQRNLVHLTIKDPANDKTILDQPILSLSLNRTEFISAFNLRVHVSDTTEVTFKLVEGDGPVHLITSKILEPPFDFGGYSSEEDDDQFDTMSVTSDEDAAQSAGDRTAQLNLAEKSPKKTKKQSPASGNSHVNNSNSNAGEPQQPQKKRKKNE